MLMCNFKNTLYYLDTAIIARSPILKLIDAIRNSNPASSYIYKNGCCYQFALILRSQFKGEIWYAPVPGHVYFKHKNKFYDIDGLCLNPPKNIQLLEHRDGHRPHRWKLREQAASVNSERTEYYHKSNPMNRASILKSGLQPTIGESYALHYRDKETEMLGRVIFASKNVNKIYDTTYDDDVWAIKNPDNFIWHEDPSLKYPFIYTEDAIPKENLVLIYRGTGNSTF